MMDSARIDKLEAALRAIFAADHGGSAAALREALASAALLIGWQPSGPPRQRCVEDWETGPHGGLVGDKAAAPKRACIKCGGDSLTCWGDDRSGHCETLKTSWLSGEPSELWRYQNRSDCQDEHPRGGIFHGPDSPIPDLVREDPTIAAGDPA